LEEVQVSDPKPPQVTQRELDAATIAVAIEGEIDLASIDRLRGETERAIDGDAGQLVIDLTECEFIDSSVLALFVELRKRLNSTSRSRFAIVADGQPLQVIETTQLDREIPVCSSADDAVRAVSG
jgi:anti-sigma B factor antagonist